ncbi:PREDICTED: glucan endo-1,3-beta-D-glucosidase-like [Prunus mume]|uniref:Glucan endo-1,3-beta-D-glucosidase-like n=1 Tax=Prunus mume TaxID=102107 RepID=A0ABM1LL87_PRUMU|nr:PREDICTED: glucan endo-1,3-beta-D-glucosidase-like [Prunus mume]
MAKLALPGPVISLLLLFFFSGEILMLVNGQVTIPAANLRIRTSTATGKGGYNPCCQFVSGGSGPPLPQEKEDTWCVPKPGTPYSALQNIINFTCGILKECSEIQEHGSCYFPNTLINHASFAMNLSYKTDGRYNCDFNGVGLIVVTNPSFGDCIYA